MIETNIVRNDLLTCQQAADRKGVHVAVLQQWIRKGKLRLAPGFHQPEEGLPVRVPRGGRGNAIPCLTPETVDAIESTPRPKWSQRKENEELYKTGEKRCSDCATIKPIAQYGHCKTGQFELKPRCIACQKKANQKQVIKYRDKRTAYKRQYRAENREKIKAYKREYGRRVTREKGELLIKRRRYAVIYHAANLAVQWGKSSPICRKEGFAIARDRNGKLRAARLDRPLMIGERAIAHFQFNSSVGKWIVLAPPLTSSFTSEEERILKMYRAQEAGLTFKRVIQKRKKISAPKI